MQEFPSDVLALIAKSLSEKDFLNFRLACKNFNSLRLREAGLRFLKKDVDSFYESVKDQSLPDKELMIEILDKFRNSFSSTDKMSEAQKLFVNLLELRLERHTIDIFSQKGQPNNYKKIYQLLRRQISLLDGDRQLVIRADDEMHQALSVSISFRRQFLFIFFLSFVAMAFGSYRLAATFFFGSISLMGSEYYNRGPSRLHSHYFFHRPRGQTDPFEAFVKQVKSPPKPAEDPLEIIDEDSTTSTRKTVAKAAPTNRPHLRKR